MKMNLLKSILKQLEWLAKYSYFFIAFIICLSIVFLSKNYFTPNFSKGYLIGKQLIFPYFKFALYPHIISAPIIFILGLFQQIKPKSKYHKTIGKFYIILVLFIGAPSGLFMSFFAIGGYFAISNFMILSFLWFYVTFKSYREVIKGDITLHKQFITRSFILTNSAILLRLFSYLNNHYNLLDTINSYVIIAWISWLPWLLIYELYIISRKNIKN